MTGYKNNFGVAKKAAEVVQKKNNNLPMVSFIHNGSETITMMGYNFKTKSTKFRAPFLR